MTAKTISYQWHDFVNKIGVQNEHPVAKLERQKTFYAGYYSCVASVLVTLVENPRQLTTILESHQQEMAEFVMSILTNKNSARPTDEKKEDNEDNP